MATDLLSRARRDAGVFAEALIGQPLWPHQLEVVRSPARIRVLCCGRQSGKSRTLAVLALHTAFTRPGARVLILSAGEASARELLGEVAALLASPLLAGSAVDENASRVTLTNGSTITSVPASPKQVRGKAIDLLIVDEAGFVDRELWVAAQFTVISRPGSRIVLSSTPWGSHDHFFAAAWRRAEAGGGEYAGWRWPSTISPLVQANADLLEEFRSTMSDREYRREVLAEWVDEAGQYFTIAELEAATADYALIDPARAGGQPAVGGLDWGMARDANAIVLLSVLDDRELVAGGRTTFFVPWLEAHHRMAYHVFIERIVEIADPDRGFWLKAIASETNGVGAMPTEVLAEELFRHRRRTGVAGVATDARRKMTGFAAIKMLIQQGRLVLPRHVELMRELSSLEFVTTESGNLRIAVPEHLGHDDLAMALMQAASAIDPRYRLDNEDDPMLRRRRERERITHGELLTTDAGTVIPTIPRCHPEPRWALVYPSKSGEQVDW